jgi:hypothetical protein
MHQPPDLSAELNALTALERTLAKLESNRVPAQPAERVAAIPRWIWYPEGQPARDAPAEKRYFRCTFDVSAVESVRSAELRIAADDACEVFVNGTRVGLHETWQSAAVFKLGERLKSGRNVLAVRAENRPAPSANPAGLVARLAVKRRDGRLQVVVSDESWQTENKERSGWTEVEFDDRAWPAARIAAPFGGGPWRRIRGLTDPDGQGDPDFWYADEDPAIKELYFAVRRLKRRIVFQNPRLDFDRIVFIDQPYPQGGAWAHESIHRMGHRAVPGGRLLVSERTANRTNRAFSSVRISTRAYRICRAAA